MWTRVLRKIGGPAPRTRHTATGTVHRAHLLGSRASDPDTCRGRGIHYPLSAGSTVVGARRRSSAATEEFEARRAHKHWPARRVNSMMTACSVCHDEPPSAAHGCVLRRGDHGLANVVAGTRLHRRAGDVGAGQTARRSRTSVFSRLATTKLDSSGRRHTHLAARSRSPTRPCRSRRTTLGEMSRPAATSRTARSSAALASKRMRQCLLRRGARRRAAWPSRAAAPRRGSVPFMQSTLGAPQRLRERERGEVGGGVPARVTASSPPAAPAGHRAEVVRDHGTGRHHAPATRTCTQARSSGHLAARGDQFVSLP